MIEEKKAYVLDPAQKVPLSEKLFFGAADLYGGGAMALITAVYLVFLVNNGLAIGLAGVIVAIAKIWDAVTDPFMGVISDNTRTKWGRRRPYMFAGGFLVILSFLLLFLPLNKVNSVALKFSVYLFAFLFYSTLSTIINVPYSAMSSEISTDYYEKTKVNTIRLIFSMVSGGISSIIPMLLIERLNNGKMTVVQFSLVMILVFGTFYCIPLILAAIKCRERVVVPKEKSTFDFKTFVKPLQVKAFVYLLIFYLAAYSCMDIIATNVVFFAKYGLQFGMSSFVILILIMGFYALMVPVHSYLLSKGWAKPKLFRMGIPLYIVGVVMLCLYPTALPDWPILVISGIIGIGMSGCQMMPWIIFPDVVDVAELKFNNRPTGSFSGLMTFIKKTTSAIAIALTSFVLHLTKFIEPVADTNGIVAEVTQPFSAVIGLRMVIMVPVVIFTTIAYIYAKKLKLTPERSCKIKEFIDLQNEGRLSKENVSPEDWAEYQAIQRDLF